MKPDYTSPQTTTTTIPVYQPTTPSNSGWSCPRCSHIYAPNVTECWRCNATQTYPYWSNQR